MLVVPFFICLPFLGDCRFCIFRLPLMVGCHFTVWIIPVMLMSL